VVLTKSNYTHGLVLRGRTLAITVLRESQLQLLWPLGMRSGRDGEKLEGLAFELTEAGDPYFTDGVGFLRCDVIEDYDMGDSTAFLCGVRERRELAGGEPIGWAAAQRILGSEFMAAYGPKREHDADIARATMRWRDDG
jgi:flavin reductase (DIM6/NTAB) family NADH-FMN oxidoreductase RutF